MNTHYALTPVQARKLVLHAQGLPPKAQRGAAQSVTLSSIEHLGYVQIDTISVVQRAHHHTLWNRNPRYQLDHLDALLQQRKIFEYWSHAAAYLPMCDYRYSLFKKESYAAGKQHHWYANDRPLMNSVLKRIEAEGPLMAKDFEGKANIGAGWGSKPTKRALENLFMQGSLMVTRRQNFHKVYDLTERVVPSGIDVSMPTEDEYARYLVLSYLRSNGIGKAAEIRYLLKNTKTMIDKALKEMLEDEIIVSVSVAGEPYYSTLDHLQQMNRPLAKSKLKILSPFDNLLIQRKRMKTLFDYDYLLECYVPEAKRKHGYFCLPILWNGGLVARVDCKADRKTATLQVLHLHMDSLIKSNESFIKALQDELIPFAQFNQCQNIDFHQLGMHVSGL